jgi:hypothetical protein
MPSRVDTDMMDISIKWMGDLAKQIAKEKGNAELEKLANQVLEESMEMVPKASRALMGSGAVQRIEDIWFIYYDTPYAVRQHEDSTLRHPDPNNPVSVPGTSSHYLLIPLQKARDKKSGWKGWF